MKEHLQENESLMTDMHTEKHEFRRHIQALQSLIFLNRIDQAKQYIDGIAETYWNTDQGVFIPHPALNSLVNSKLSLAKSQGIEFHVSTSDDFTSLQIDPWDLCSIVGNILDNAIEAALQDKEQPWVELELDHQNGEFMVAIRNNGATISRDDRQRVFEAGFTHKESIGRGYGLYIVQKLVSQYRGKVEVVSGQHTTLMVIIPGNKSRYDFTSWNMAPK
jgi:sensor histidine kinase regulating citrate/malate metabolism